MAEADPNRVIVELIAKTDGFDGKVTQSATNFERSTAKIGKAGSDAERVLENLRKKLDAALAAGNTQKADAIAANIRKIEAASNTAAASVERLGTRTGTAMTAVDRSMRQATQRSRLLGFQISDIGTQLSAGASPFIVLAQQGPQVANALDGAKGAVGRFASFLSGPWGAALLAATTILGGFLFRAKEAADGVDDLVEKLKENAEKTRKSNEANEIFANTLEGVTQALNDNEKALKGVEEGHKTAAQQALEGAIAARARLEGLRAETLAMIENAKALLEFQRARASGPGQGAELAALRLDDRRKALESLERALGKVDEAAKRADDQITRALGRRVVERAQRDAAEVANDKFDAQVRAAEKAATKEEILNGTLRRQVDLIEAARKAELKRIQDTERERNKTGANRETGRELTAGEAASIARAAGLVVNSAGRTFAEQKRLYDAWIKAGKPSDNPVAPPGTSAHEGARGRWALDIQLTKGLTPDLIRKVFAAQGVNLTKVFKERGHFHVEGSRAQADAAETETARLAEQELNRVQAFQNEKAGLENQVIDAQQSLVTSAEKIAELELQAIDLAHDRYADEVAHLEEIGKLHGDEAKELLKLNDERAALRKEAVKRREDERKFRIEAAAAQRFTDVRVADLQNQADVLQGQQRLADTQKERRDIERRLIDLQFQEERLRLQYQIGYAERLKTQEGISDSEKAEAEAQAAIARMKLSTIDQRQANTTAAADRANAGPLQDFFSGIPDTADEINEALEGIATGGLATFTDALTEAIVQWHGFGDAALSALQAVTAELVKLAIQQIIVNTIGKAFGKDQKTGADAAKEAAVALTAELTKVAAQQIAQQAIAQALGAATTAATVAQATAVGLAWAPAAAAASLATLGANAGPAAAALAATTALATALAVPKFAAGGRILGPGSSMSDSVPIMASNDEFMVRAKAARRIGYDRLEYINRTGELPMLAEGGRVIGPSAPVKFPMFAEGGRVRGITPMNTPASQPARGGFSTGDISQLRSLIGEAVNAGIGAMPDLNVINAVDPGDMLQKGLGTPKGSRALLNYISSNPNAIRGAQRQP